jgi:hypothetical protein
MDLQLIYESIHLLISTLVFSKFFTMMVLFPTILVNMTTICLWKKKLSFLIEDYDVTSKVNCFSNNLVNVLKLK